MGVVADVAAYIEANGLAGGSTDWVLVRRAMTDNVDDQCVVIAEDGGPPPEFPEPYGIGDSALTEPAVMVSVRGEPWDSDATHQKADDIRAALHGLRDLFLVSGGGYYMRIKSRTPEPVFVGFDDRNRPRHTIAFLMLMAQT